MQPRGAAIYKKLKKIMEKEQPDVIVCTHPMCVKANISCLCSSRRDEHNAPERRIHMDFYRQFKQWTQCYRSYIYKHKCHKQTIDQFLAPEIFTGKYISCHACDN